jgi:hypothetical protein
VFRCLQHTSWMFRGCATTWLVDLEHDGNCAADSKFEGVVITQAVPVTSSLSVFACHVSVTVRQDRDCAVLFSNMRLFSEVRCFTGTLARGPQG